MYKVLAFFCYIISAILLVIGLVGFSISIPIAMFFIVFGVFFILIGLYSWKYKAIKKNLSHVQTYTPHPATAMNSNTSDNMTSHNEVSNSLQTNPDNVTAQELFAPCPDFISDMKKKYEYTNVGIYSSSDNPTYTSKINAYVSFKQEPENKYDNNAVAVIYKEKKIGYLYKGKLQDMVNDYINRNFTIIAKFDTESTLCIAFYRHLSNLKKEYDSFIISLTKLSKKDCFDSKRSENLELCSAGDDVELMYDYESERYIAICNGSEIGEVNEANSQKLSERIESCNYISVIHSLDTLDKISCKIVVYIEK